MFFWGWRDVSGLRALIVSTEFSAPIWLLTTPVTPVPDDMMSSFGLHEHCTHMVHRHTWSQNAHKINKSKMLF